MAKSNIHSLWALPLVFTICRGKCQLLNAPLSPANWQLCCGLLRCFSLETVACRDHKWQQKSRESETRWENCKKKKMLCWIWGLQIWVIILCSFKQQATLYQICIITIATIIKLLIIIILSHLWLPTDVICVFCALCTTQSSACWDFTPAYTMRQKDMQLLKTNGWKDPK